MDSQQTELQHLQEIRDQIKDVNFANPVGIKLAKELLAKAASCIDRVVAEEGAKVCYQEIIDIATQENLLKVSAKDFAEILELVNNIMRRRDFNIQSTFIDRAIAGFSEDSKRYFSTPKELLKLVAPISQMGFGAQHFQKSGEVLQNMLCELKNSTIISDEAVNLTASAMLHAKNIGFLDQDNAKAILTKINRFYSRKVGQSSQIVTPDLEEETFNNIFEIAAYYEAAFDLEEKDKMPAGFKRRFFSGKYKRKPDSSDFQREIFEKIYKNIAGAKKVVLEKDEQGRVIKATIDDLIEVELEGRYCKIGNFFKAGDVVIHNKQTKEIISIIELDGKEHEASIDGIRVDRGKYLSRDKVIAKSCHIPLFIKHKDFADYNKDKSGFVAKLLQGVNLKIAQDFASEDARKKELAMQEAARRQAEQVKEEARRQEEAKKKDEENQRQKQKISTQTVDFLVRANADIMAKMQAAIEAAKAPSDPLASLQEYRNSLQQQLSQLQAQINQIFVNEQPIERQEAQAEVASVNMSTNEFLSKPSNAVSQDLAMLGGFVEEDATQQDSQESSESPESESGVKKYNIIEEALAKNLLRKNHKQVEWILDQVKSNLKKTNEYYDLNSFVFLDGEHQGKTAMQFAIETEDRDLAAILFIYGVTNLPEGYRLQKNHPFFDYLQKIFRLEQEPEQEQSNPEPEDNWDPDDIVATDTVLDPLSPSTDDSKHDDDFISTIVATIVDSFERGDLKLFEDTLTKLDQDSFKKITENNLFSYGEFDKMTLASFVILKAMEEDKLPDGFIVTLSEMRGVGFFNAKIAKGEDVIKTMQYIIDMTSAGKALRASGKFFNELASFGIGDTILFLALNQNIKNKFFLDCLQKAFTPQEILHAITRIGKEASVIMNSKMNEVGRSFLNKVAIDGDDDLAVFFIQNYDLLVAMQSSQDNKFHVQQILGRALDNNNVKIARLVLQEYPELRSHNPVLFAKASNLLDVDNAANRYLIELDWTNPPKDRQKLKEILSDAILKRKLDVAKKAIAALEFDAQTQAADEVDIMPQIVASGNLDLVISYVKKIARKENDEKSRREVELETLYKCFDCALKKRSCKLAMRILDSEEYGKEFLAYRFKADGRGALFLAVEASNFIVIQRLLNGVSDEVFARYSQVDRNGYSALHFAAERGNYLSVFVFTELATRFSAEKKIKPDLILQFLQSKTNRGETANDVAARVLRAAGDDQSSKQRRTKSVKLIHDAIKRVTKNEVARQRKMQRKISEYPDLAKGVMNSALASNPFQAKKLSEVIQRGCRLKFDMPALLRHLLPLHRSFPESRLVECIKVMAQNGVKFASTSHPGVTPLEYTIQENLKDVAKILLKNGEIISTSCVSKIWFAQKDSDQDIANFLFENYPIQFAKAFEALDFQGQKRVISQEYCHFLKIAADANMVDVVRMMLKNRDFFTTQAQEDVADESQQRCEFLSHIIYLPKSDFWSQRARERLFKMVMNEYRKHDPEFDALRKSFQERGVLQDFDEACKAISAPTTQKVEAHRLNLDDCKEAIKRAMVDSDSGVIETLFARICEFEKEKYNLEFVELAVEKSRPDAIKSMLKAIGEERAFAVLCQAIKYKSNAAIEAITRQQRQIFAEETPPKPDRWKNFINQKKDGKTIAEIALEENSQKQLRDITIWGSTDSDSPYYQLEWKNNGFLFLLIEHLASLEVSDDFGFYHQLFIDIINYQEVILSEPEYKKFINQTNASGSSLLFWMIKYLPNNALYKLLIEKGIEKGALDDKDENKNLCFAACKTAKSRNVAMALDLLVQIFGTSSESIKSIESIHASLNSVVDAKSKKTLLMEAAKCSNDYLLKIMLAQKECDLTALDAEGNSIWHYLASAPEPAISDKSALASLERCATSIFDATGVGDITSVNPSMKSSLIQASRIGNLNRNGESPLEVAIKSGNIAIAKILVKRGAIENGAFQQKSIEESTKERAKILNLAAVKKKGISGGDRDLILAIIACQKENCGTKKTKEVENQTHQFVNFKNRLGSTALHTAAMCGNISAIEGLVESGAKMDVEVANDLGQSPFHVAVAMGNCEAVEALLKLSKQKGAQSKAALSKTTEKLIDQATKADTKLRPIEIAVSRDDFEMAEFLLKNGALLNEEIEKAMLLRAKPEQKDSTKIFLEKNEISVALDDSQLPQGNVTAGSAVGAAVQEGGSRG